MNLIVTRDNAVEWSAEVRANNRDGMIIWYDVENFAGSLEHKSRWIVSSQRPCSFLYLVKHRFECLTCLFAVKRRTIEEYRMNRWVRHPRPFCP